VWSLTEKGQTQIEITDSEAAQLFKEQHALHSFGKEKDRENEGDDGLVDSQENYKKELLGILQTLPPKGFERLCQRLLRESNFEEVQVTGRSGDGGIDGIGIVKVNQFVTFRVLFQCKKYSGAVSASEVRDFRGAMQGRADKAIFLTTGTYTKDARREAVRDGVPPIELVNGEQLILLFEELKLGLIPRTTFDVDVEFFKQFMAPEIAP
jgi:restriction system protein